MTRTSVCLPGARAGASPPARPDVEPGTPSQLSVAGILNLNTPLATAIPDGLSTLPSRGRLERARNFFAHRSRPAVLDARNGACSTVEHSFDGVSKKK
jgi:hypothetical protein